MKPPIAPKTPVKLIKHGHERIDNYFWMNERENPAVIDYLNAENAYCKSVLEPTEKLQDELYREMKGRIKEEDMSAPYFKNGFWYYHRYEEGQEHPVHCRRKESMEKPEEVMIDENTEAENYPYYEVVALSISKDNKILAFSEDISGRRLYRTRFKNLETGEILPNEIENTGGDLAWINHGEYIYFNRKDVKTLRPYQIVKYNFNDQSEEVVFEEKDDTFICSVSKTKDFEYILIGSYSTLTTEFRFKSADRDNAFEIFLERDKGHEYYPEPGEGGFYIKSNHNAINFKVAYCSVERRNPESWKIIQDEDPDVYIEDIEVFKEFLAVQEKENGLTRLKFYSTKDFSFKVLPPFEETYTMYIGTNAEFNTKSLRIGYSSLTTPHSVFQIDMVSLERKLVKQTEVLGEFNAEDYQSERVWATASDGIRIPISLVYKKALFKKDGANPLLQYAYGSYGSTIDPYFSSVRLSLLNRGFVYAIAHVRGGEYLGRRWYEEGKLLKKKNTFTDFIACAEFLISEKYCDPGKVFAMGGSAGGLLMGAIANMRPDLWRGIVSNVPFVDVATTMLDDSIPLTTGEYDEWGNPNDEEHFNYILSYSPYDQIRSADYPAMFISSGLHDSQVQYWEPTKYVAKLRELKTDNNPVLLHTNMEAGHGGASGRFEQLKEIAMEYAFFFNLIDNQ